MVRLFLLVSVGTVFSADVLIRTAWATKGWLGSFSTAKVTALRKQHHDELIAELNQRQKAMDQGQSSASTPRHGLSGKEGASAEDDEGGVHGLGRTGAFELSDDNAQLLPNSAKRHSLIQMYKAEG